MSQFYFYFFHILKVRGIQYCLDPDLLLCYTSHTGLERHEVKYSELSI